MARALDLQSDLRKDQQREAFAEDEGELREQAAPVLRKPLGHEVAVEVVAVVNTPSVGQGEEL